MKSWGRFPGLCLLLTGVCLPGPAMADQDAEFNRAMVEGCRAGLRGEPAKSVGAEALAIFCLGYVEDIAKQMARLCAKCRACPDMPRRLMAEGVPDARAAAKAYLAWIEADPARIGEHPGRLAMDAIAAAYPCRRSESEGDKK